MNTEFKELLDKQTKILFTLAENIAELTVKIKGIVDKLDYRKQAREERFIPPENSQNRGED